MDTVKEVLLRELKKLKAEEFNDFKFHLEEYGSKVRSVQGEDRAVISPCDLENADRRRAVDLIVQTYSPEPLQVAKDVLEKVGRHDLIESLDRSSSRNTGRSTLVLVL